MKVDGAHSCMVSQNKTTQMGPECFQPTVDVSFRGNPSQTKESARGLELVVAETPSIAILTQSFGLLVCWERAFSSNPAYQQIRGNLVKRPLSKELSIS